AFLGRGDLTGAAALLEGRGEPGRAVGLYERACDFAAATRAALTAGEHREAVRLAVIAGDPVLAEKATAALLAGGDDALSRRVADDLQSRSYYQHAARLYRGIGDHEQAALAYERAGQALEASRSFDAASLPAEAARVLTAAIRAGAEDDSDGLRVALGRLYARHDKHQAAVRVLQQLDERSDHRRRALVILVRSLKALGLRQALRDLEPELAARGIDPDAEQEQEAAVADEPAGAVLYGRYRVLRDVATTPHARLYEALDTLTGERVAVKVFVSRGDGTGRDALARFVREARALAKLRHPSVVPLLAYVDEGPAMVLRWMGGGSLRDLLARESLSPARAAEIIRAVLDALAEAHRLGILHRDLKPSNLLFDEGGAARLADFGAAHVAASEATVTVGEIGTVAYMAPEQRQGQAATAQSDLYAAGVLLFEMLTGTLPSAGAPVTVSSAHPDLESVHDALLRRFLALEPEARFPGALEARRAVEDLAWSPRVIERARRHPSTVPPPHHTSERLEPPRRRGDGHDRWLERDVVVLPLDDETLAAAAAFARAGHPALATVLRADREEGEIWIEAPRGRPLSQGLTLTATQAASLRRGLEALHAAGGVHGAVDAEHVFIHADAACLTYPVRRAAAADADADRAALALLVEGVRRASPGAGA
ncbi:MAG: protein kinase, partial [Myxococcales bacterium]|nr:protein kinase [Myxococcales bacterium]